MFVVSKAEQKESLEKQRFSSASRESLNCRSSIKIKRLFNEQKKIKASPKENEHFHLNFLSVLVSLKLIGRKNYEIR